MALGTDRRRVRVGNGRKGQVFRGASGLIRYLGSGDPEKAVVILQFKGGRAVTSRLLAQGPGR